MYFLKKLFSNLLSREKKKKLKSWIFICFYLFVFVTEIKCLVMVLFNLWVFPPFLRRQSRAAIKVVNFITSTPSHALFEFSREKFQYETMMKQEGGELKKLITFKWKFKEILFFYSSTKMTQTEKGALKIFLLFICSLISQLFFNFFYY